MFRYLLLALVFVIGAPAVADSPSYNYIQAGYQAIDIDFGDGLDVDGDGYGVNASFEIGDRMFGFATYAKSDFDFGVDLGSGSDDTAVGGGICFNFTDRFALALTASAGSDITTYGAGARLYFGN